MSPPAARISPPIALSPADAIKQEVVAETAAGTLPPDLMGAWQTFAVALGQSLPTSINRAAAHRRAFRRAVK